MDSICVSLKRNSNISFSIIPEICECKRPMFLRKNKDGNIFWSCKGYHPDKNKMKCDHTKNDLQCFKCKSGKMLRKKSKDDKFFYGCTNFSDISQFSCSAVLQTTDIQDVITQVNNATKHFYNFETTISNEKDDKKLKNVSKILKDDKEIEKSDDEVIPKKSIKSFIENHLKKLHISNKKVVTTKLVGFISIIFMIITLFATLQGSGVSIDLLGLFKIEVEPRQATTQDILAHINSDEKTLEIKNISEESVKVNDIVITNETSSDFVPLDKINTNNKVLQPGEMITISQDSLNDFIEPEVSHLVGPISADNLDSSDDDFWSSQPIIITNRDSLYLK